MYDFSAVIGGVMKVGELVPTLPPPTSDHWYVMGVLSPSVAVTCSVAVFPTKKSQIKNPMVFFMELQKQRSHGHSRWLVDQWVPAPGSAQVVQGSLDPTAADRSTPPPQGLGAVWLALPAGIVAMILAIPLTLGVREWRRSRRARRSYESTLPPLSQYGSGR